VPFVAVNLEPVFGAVDDYVPILEAAVNRLERATGLAPFIVAHSMGGLAVRAWMASCPSPRVAHVVTIGTPHRGTWLARFSLSANGLQMRQNSAWLQALTANDGLGFARFTCFYSHCDNIVFPTSTATLPGADNRHVPGSAHVHLAFQEAVVSEVLHLLESSAQAVAVPAAGAQAAR
jgi:triacylglycerol lipase